MRRHLEDTEAMALMDWASRMLYQGKPVSEYLLHYPAGGKRNVREAGRLRRMGVRAGVPDYFLHVPKYNGAVLACGLWIELKVPRATAGRQTYATDLQLAQISHLILCGYKAVIAHGWMAAADEIAKYLGIRSPMDVSR